MGLFKAWKEVKAVAASGTSTGPLPPGGPRPHGPGVAFGFAMAMMKTMGPLLAAEAPERGDPLPGTEAGVLGPQDPGAMEAAMAAVVARDSAFDPRLLTTFADQVFAAVSAAWGSGDSASVRPVLADGIWDDLAAAVVLAGAGGSAMILSRQAGRSTLAGVWAGTWYDTARFNVAVSLDIPAEMAAEAPPGFGPWNEDWLFQRSVTPGGPSVMPAESCPSCGAPTSTDASGACTHCHQPIPLLTSGWVLTAIRSHNPMVEMVRDQVITAARQNPAEFAQMPDELLRVLPADLVAQIAPDRAATLHPRP